MKLGTFCVAAASSGTPDASSPSSSVMATINPPPMIFPKGTRDAKIPALATSASLVAIPALTSPRHGSRSLRSSRVDGESNDRSSRRQDGPNGARYFPNLSGQQGTCLISAQARLDQRTVRQVVEAHTREAAMSFWLTRLGRAVLCRYQVPAWPRPCLPRC